MKMVEDIVWPTVIFCGRYDGDLAVVINNQIMMNGVDRNAAIVIDIEDKATALVEKDNMENRIACIMRGLSNKIGEISNMASAYHNKMPKSASTKDRYEKYIDLLSVINGKEIDRAKTGVAYPIPKNIAKYGRPLPYFMKYAGPYYKNLHTFSYARSNMNQLCMDIEDWEHGVRRKKRVDDFNWRIMLNEDIPYNEDTFAQIEKAFTDFNSTMRRLKSFEKKCKNYKYNKKELDELGLTREEAKNYEVDWEYYYNVFRARCEAVCPDVCELANIVVTLSYEKYPTCNKKFMWGMAARGIVENIKQQPLFLPEECEDGEYDYLGRKYTINKVDIMEGGE